jgi:hypothetical protein
VPAYRAFRRSIQLACGQTLNHLNSASAQTNVFEQNMPTKPVLQKKGGESRRKKAPECA